MLLILQHSQWPNELNTGNDNVKDVLVLHDPNPIDPAKLLFNDKDGARF